jgi:polymorphic membrane protein
MSVTFSTLSGNSANYGGAIWGHYYFGLIGGSTFENNTSKYGGAVDSPFSGIYDGAIFDSTISGNSASEAGGGIYAYAARVFNTILANNDGADAAVAFLYGQSDLIRDPGMSGLDGGNNLLGADPQLGALGNNGGNTPTMKPALSSPVLDAGYSGAYVDQRFSQRPVDLPTVANTNAGNGSDIGAVELTAAEGPQPPATQQPQPPVVTKPKCKKHKKKHRSAESAKKKKCKKKHKKHAAKATSDRAISAWRAELRSARSQGPWADRAWKSAR